jgi:Zn-dependent peptidase ImmA (M78 family)
MAGMSMDDLVEKMAKKVSKPAISKYERGLMRPESPILIALADTLGVGIDYFFSSNTLELSSLNFRKKASLGKKTVQSLTERVRDALQRYAEIENLVDEKSSFLNPLSNFKIRTQEDAEMAAMELRKAWELGQEGGIAHVIDLLEEHGVKVVEIEGDAGFDGLSGFVGPDPFIVINANYPTDRKRFTALHEFAHLALLFADSVDEKEREKLCHGFGGVFLVPCALLVKELGGKRSDISYYELGTLKAQYGISMQAIMYRARACRIISEYAYETFFVDLSRRQWRRMEPGGYPFPERPQRFMQLVHRALSEGAISLSKAAELSRKSIDTLEKERNLVDENHHP